MCDLMDDPTWDCDYHSRCANRILKVVLDDYENLRKKFDGFEIPYNLHKEIDGFKEKWLKVYKDNEGDDK